MTDVSLMKVELRISILGLLGFIGLVAVACVAIVERNHWWSCGLFTATLASVVAASMVAIFGRNRFAVGFVFGGLLYLTLVFGPWFNANIRPRLATTKGLAYLYLALESPGPNDSVVDGYLDLGKGVGEVDVDGDGDLDALSPSIFTEGAGHGTVHPHGLSQGHIHDIGQCCFMWMTAIVCGLTARAFS